MSLIFFISSLTSWVTGAAGRGGSREHVEDFFPSVLVSSFAGALSLAFMVLSAMVAFMVASSLKTSFLISSRVCDTDAMSFSPEISLFWRFSAGSSELSFSDSARSLFSSFALSPSFCATAGVPFWPSFPEAKNVGTLAFLIDAFESLLESFRSPFVDFVFLLGALASLFRGFLFALGARVSSLELFRLSPELSVIPLEDFSLLLGIFVSLLEALPFSVEIFVAPFEVSAASLFVTCCFFLISVGVSWGPSEIMGRAINGYDWLVFGAPKLAMIVFVFDCFSGSGKWLLVSSLFNCNCGCGC